MSVRVLFVMNPGRQSRHYLAGLVRAAQRLHVPHTVVELQHVWQRMERAADRPAELRAMQTDLLRLIRTETITHAISYIYNGVFDFGAVRTASDPKRPILTALGVRHILLWTDHPDWAREGSALKSPMAAVLRDPLMSHIVKSAAAAGEVRDVLSWPSVSAMPMAEDYHALQPARGVEPIHDVVAIVGDAAPVPEVLHLFLAEHDPDPAAIDAIMRPAAKDRFLTDNPGMERLADAWLDARQRDPTRSLWSLANDLPREHSAALALLRESPERWYTAIAALRTMTSWRRFFWLAWLSGRVNVGVYGSSAPGIGIESGVDHAKWVEYEDQPAIYARGKIALNINAGHDEEGLTHKPFQIAAAGLPCIHHESRGLFECFEPDSEVISFRRGPDLLDTVRSLVGNETRRAALAESMRVRALRDHAWENRLVQLLAENQPQAEAKPMMTPAVGHP